MPTSTGAAEDARVTPAAGEDETVRRLIADKTPPPLWRRIRNGTPAASAGRYDLPADFADRIREAVTPFGVRLDVVLDERRLFVADLVGSEAQINMAAAAVLNFVDEHLR